MKCLPLHAALALLMLFCSAASAQESPSDTQARTHFEAARLHFDRGAYEEALREFQAAYELSHRAELLYNIYLTTERLADYAGAITYLERYLTEGSPDAERRAVLEPRLVNLRERRDRHTTPEPIAEAPSVAPAEPPPATVRHEGDIVPAAIAFGVAGAGLVTFAIAGGLALSEDDALASRCGGGCSDAQVSTLGTLTLVADIGWITAAVGAAAGVVLLLTLGMPSEEHVETARVVPWVTPNGGGLVAAGSF